MNEKIWAIAIAGLLAGCTPLGLYYKEGVRVQTATDAQTSCEVQAAKDVPVALETYVTPGRYTPARKVCDKNGSCHIEPGFFLPPEYVTRDINRDLRAKAVDLCMRQKGYAYVRLPACDAAIAKQVPEGQTTRLPRLTDASCVVRASDGRWQIVTP